MPPLIQALCEAIRTPGLVEEFDRLRGTNLSRKGTNLDLQIDLASGRMGHDMRLFVEFIQDAVINRIAPERGRAK